MAAALQDGVRLSQTSPAFLHANSTSHTWIFSAIAELIDNAYDPDVAATVLWIGKKVITKNVCLVFQDNGAGMQPEKLHRMLSFGYCEKVTINGHRPVGHYGNGFKSGSMRLGKDAIVFTKSTSTMSVGFLSQSYLKAIRAETVLVPIVSWDIKSKKRIRAMDSEGSLRAITTYSLFKHEEVLLQELEAIGGTGTRIILYNLKRGSDNKLELDFESNPIDIINSEHMEMDLNNTYRPVRDDVPEYRRSLREYCSILFLKPRMKIFIRGTKVKTKLVAKSLSKTETDFYRPTWLTKPVKIIFGFGPNHQHHEYGIMMYHRNRLIKAYEKVGYQRQANELGVGVVGVVEVDFLEPIHNKQDFNKTDRYNACNNALTMKLNDYWNAKMGTSNGRVVPPVTQGRPDWTWVQCDNCLKWRRLLDGIDRDSLPDKWFCYMNRDPRHNRCDIEEEPEDEDELFKNSNYQREKTLGRKVKEREKKADLHKIIQKEQYLNQKEQELMQMKHQIERMQPLETPGRGASRDKKPTVADLEKAKQDLVEAQRREAQQRAVIQQLQEQKKKIEHQQNIMRDRVMNEVNAKNPNTPTGAAKRKSSGPLKVALFTNKKARVEAQGPDFIVTRNESDSEEDRNKADKSDVIILDSDSEDEGTSTSKGKGKGKGKKSSSSSVDVKPDKAELDKQMQSGNKDGSAAKPATPSKNTSSTDKSKGKSSDTPAGATKLVNRMVQTLPVEIKESGKGKDGADPVKLKKDLQKTKTKLSTLRKHVMQLLQIIVPDIDLGGMDTVDDVVVEMIRVNGGEKELESRSASPNSKCTEDGNESENEENKDSGEKEKDAQKTSGETASEKDKDTNSRKGSVDSSPGSAESQSTKLPEMSAVQGQDMTDSADIEKDNDDKTSKENEENSEVPMETEEISSEEKPEEERENTAEKDDMQSTNEVESEVMDTEKAVTDEKIADQESATVEDLDVSGNQDKTESEPFGDQIDPSSEDQEMTETFRDSLSNIIDQLDVDSNNSEKRQDETVPENERRKSTESRSSIHNSTERRKSTESASSRRNSTESSKSTKSATAGCNTTESVENENSKDKTSSDQNSGELSQDLKTPSSETQCVTGDPPSGRNSPQSIPSRRNSETTSQTEEHAVQNGVSHSDSASENGRKTPNSVIGEDTDCITADSQRIEENGHCDTDIMSQKEMINVTDDPVVKTKDTSPKPSDVVDLLDDDGDEDDVLIVESQSVVKEMRKKKKVPTATLR